VGRVQRCHPSRFILVTRRRRKNSEERACRMRRYRFSSWKGPEPSRIENDISSSGGYARLSVPQQNSCGLRKRGSPVHSGMPAILKRKRELLILSNLFPPIPSPNVANQSLRASAVGLTGNPVAARHRDSRRARPASGVIAEAHQVVRPSPCIGSARAGQFELGGFHHGRREGSRNHPPPRPRWHAPRHAAFDWGLSLTHDLY